MNIKQKMDTMTLEEKIGQKIMLDFRYWDPTGKSNKDMIAPDETISRLITDNHIGGVILFANNLKDKLQIKKLTAWYAAIKTCGDVRLFIGTDNEGGNVFRLPRGDYASFPGNMALSAAIEGGADVQLAGEQGSLMAQDMLSLNINTNFAPVADVNTNPFNPVINVRSFSDDEETVSLLAENMSTGMKQQGVITAYKHFPGHGSTSTDSHTGLPRVDRSRKEAFAIDIAPYKQAIDNHMAPDMVMTAHIQYPALDNSQIITSSGKKITVPATMSHEIQACILRDELGYAGVTISDALDMGAITNHFSQEEAIENVFVASVDIALMPISISSPSQARQLSALIQYIVGRVEKGIISEADIDASVERILTLKARHHLLDEEEKEVADVATTGATGSTDNNPYPGWLRYAASLGKKRVHLSLRAPYDIVSYAEDVEAAVAAYSYYGYDKGIWRGPSMISLAEVLTGKRAPLGKLPVNTWHNYDVKTNTGTVAFPRGFGLSW